MGGSSGSSDEGKKSKGFFRIKGGVGKKNGFGAFSAYMAGKNIQGDENKNAPLPDSMKTSTLMELIFCERNWPKNFLVDDIEKLEYNRLYTVSDLRILSKDSWQSINLLPIVKDLLIEKIHKKGTKLKKMKKKLKREESSDSSEAEPSESISNGFPKLKLIDSSNSNASIKPPPGTIQAMGSKIKVSCNNGKVYEAARYCPHKGVDLANGWVSGTSVVCPKHKWEFNLAAGGRCTTKSKYSLNACQLDW